MLDADGNLPPQIIHQAFQVLKPTAQITQYVDLWERMWGDDYVTAHQAMTGWASDHIPLPGGVAQAAREDGAGQRHRQRHAASSVATASPFPRSRCRS